MPEAVPHGKRRAIRLNSRNCRQATTTCKVAGAASEEAFDTDMGSARPHSARLYPRNDKPSQPTPPSLYLTALLLLHHWPLCPTLTRQPNPRPTREHTRPNRGPGNVVLRQHTLILTLILTPTPTPTLTLTLTLTHAQLPHLRAVSATTPARCAPSIRGQASDSSVNRGSCSSATVRATGWGVMQRSSSAPPPATGISKWKRESRGASKENVPARQSGWGIRARAFGSGPVAIQLLDDGVHAKFGPGPLGPGSLGHRLRSPVCKGCGCSRRSVSLRQGVSAAITGRNHQGYPEYLFPSPLHSVALWGTIAHSSHSPPCNLFQPLLLCRCQYPASKLQFHGQPRRNPDAVH
ncbi:hypothetical protein Vafri_3639 [Volvox africanus]|uniref:Uncharacterized protein n=1 Tax=Volvox africanus TaxID=51714 RepID=A0A8J4EWK3_9CHLO|nr:hypothetical protein Vafri_3639 [Volvox africanus]